MNELPWLNFRHLYAFWAVCRFGGFGSAAKRIHVSQSTVSEQVALLEDYLGESLIERSTRSIRITDRGAALFERAESIFSQSAEIHRVFRDKQQDDVPRMVRIGMVGGISRNFIYSRITRALDQGGQVDVVDGSFDELYLLLRTFELDLIFSLDRPRQRDLRTVRSRRISSSPLCLAGTPAVMQALSNGAPPSELYLFRHPEGTGVLPAELARFGIDGRVGVWADDISLLRFLANGGRGVAVLPEIGVREDVLAGHVVTVTLEAVAPVEIYGMYLDKGGRHARVEEFLD